MNETEFRVLGPRGACVSFWRKTLALWPGVQLRDHVGRPLARLPARAEWTHLSVPSGRRHLRLGMSFDSVGDLVGHVLRPRGAIAGVVWLEYPAPNRIHPREWMRFVAQETGLPFLAFSSAAGAHALRSAGIEPVEGPPSLATRSAAEWTDALSRLFSALAELKAPRPRPARSSFRGQAIAALLFNRSSTPVTVGHAFLAYPFKATVASLACGRSLAPQGCTRGVVRLASPAAHRVGEHFSLGGNPPGFGYLLGPAR